MNVVQITRTIAGGAGTAVLRQHTALTNAGINSSVLVRTGEADHPAVSALQPAGLKAELLRLIGHWRQKRTMRPYRYTKSPKLDVFTSDQVVGVDIITDQLPEADVYNLHWISTSLDITGFARSLKPKQPVVWTLHDMNAFTGGCHYNADCERYLSVCGHCPQLGSTIQHDVSADIFSRKLKAMQLLSVDTTRIVTPSKWLQQTAKSSPILSRFNVDVVPNSLDCSIFKPQPKDIVRRELGLPSNNRIILFVADKITNYRKGIDLFETAMRGYVPGQDTSIVCAGEGGSKLNTAVQTILLGKIHDGKHLAKIYAAADVMIIPSRQDNLPNTALEAMACGVPVVGFDTGGMLDIVTEGETGLLAKPEDASSLRDAIKTILSNDEMRARMAEHSRQQALAKYSPEQQAGTLKKIYEQLIDASKGAA